MKYVINSEKKKRKKSGFTLMEMLVVTFIFSLVTALGAGLMPVILNAYDSSMDSVNAQTLISTISLKIRDEIGTASQVSVADNHLSISYISGNTGSKAYIVSEADGIYIVDYVGTDKEDKRRIVSQKAMTKGLVARFTSVEYDSDKGIVKFVNLGVINNEGKKISNLDTFLVRSEQIS